MEGINARLVMSSRSRSTNFNIYPNSCYLNNKRGAGEKILADRSGAGRGQTDLIHGFLCAERKGLRFPSASSPPQPPRLVLILGWIKTSLESGELLPPDCTGKEPLLLP